MSVEEEDLKAQDSKSGWVDTITKYKIQITGYHDIRLAYYKPVF